MTTPPAQPKIYHITHVDNLPRIIQTGGIWCDAERIRQNLAVTGIGYSHIKARRMQRSVPVAAKGVLGDYAPFYFCPRSPMLYTIHMGNVPEYQGGQSGIVHLVSTVETAWRLSRPWAFTNLHAELGYAEYFDDWSRHGEIDWEVIGSDSWGGDERRPKKMAEFLVHQFFSWTAVLGIGVINQAMETRVAEILASSVHKPQVAVMRGWYY
ncbi:MAG: DUF4433 domain-containing protein [Magnetococcales bacterium]|nr:DUF4433 domain-containing protein [Magnetococcales bacterium]